MLQSFVTLMSSPSTRPSRTREATFFGATRFGLIALLLSAVTPAYAADYLIEAIVFKWKSGQAVEETFSTDDVTESMPAQPRPVSGNLVQQVQPSLLRSAANSMQSAGAVDVLEHIGWTQSRAGQSGSPQIDMGAAAGSNLTGWVRLYSNTYLFAEIDLAMRDDNGEMVRLKQRRRVKFNEVHYFDHPRFGVVVTISPKKS